MRRTTALLLLLPAMSACVDIMGPDVGWFDFGWGDCCYPAPTTVIVQGNVTVGPFSAIDGEVTVELFDPAHPANAVAVAVTRWGQYALDLGATPPPSVCAFQLRGILWTGEVTPPRPLFDTAPSPCTLSPGWRGGAALALPAYGPLDEPFTIEGKVLVDGRPAQEQEVSVEFSLRRRSLGDSLVTVRTDADGAYRLETRDAGQRFAWCTLIIGHVRDASNRIENVYLNAVPPADCGSRRVLPDARFGTLKAAVVSLYENAGSLDRHRGAGEDARAELIRIDDGVVGEPFGPLDDGTFHVWFPYGVRDPGCDWLLRVTLANGTSEVRELFGGGYCQAPVYHSMIVSTFSTPSGSPLALSVEDPIGDNTGPTDLTDMKLRFDPQTGIYEILLVADAAQPFQGSFRVNINLFNPTRQSFFYDTMNDFNLESPTTTLRLSGFDPALRSWLPGDEVHTNSLQGTPNPPRSSLFRSGVGHFPLTFLTNEDVLGFADLATPAVVVTADPSHQPAPVRRGSGTKSM